MSVVLEHKQGLIAGDGLLPVKMAQYAKENGFDFFTTTLSISPYKNAQLLYEISKELSSKYGIAFLPSDFKKQNGYLRSTLLAAEYGLGK